MKEKKRKKRILPFAFEIAIIVAAVVANSERKKTQPQQQINSLRYEKFVVPEGVKRVAHARDTRVEHAATLTIQREDHTVGNLLRCSLLRDREVTFAGYKIPHPLEYRMLVKVQTRGRRSPKQVSIRALEALADEAAEGRRAFEAEAARVRGGDAGVGGGGVGGGFGGVGGGGDQGYGY